MKLTVDGIEPQREIVHHPIPGRLTIGWHEDTVGIDLIDLGSGITTRQAQLILDKLRSVLAANTCPEPS